MCCTRTVPSPITKKILWKNAEQCGGGGCWDVSYRSQSAAGGSLINQLKKTKGEKERERKTWRKLHKEGKEQKWHSQRDRRGHLTADRGMRIPSGRRSSRNAPSETRDEDNDDDDDALIAKGTVP